MLLKSYRDDRHELNMQREINILQYNLKGQKLKKYHFYLGLRSFFKYKCYNRRCFQTHPFM